MSNHITTRAQAIEAMTLKLFPDDFHDGTDCRGEVGREGQPCRICAERRQTWLGRVAAVRGALEAAGVVLWPAVPTSEQRSAAADALADSTGQGGGQRINVPASHMGAALGAASAASPFRKEG